MSDQYEPIKEYWIIRVGEQAEEIKRLTAERDDWHLNYDNAVKGWINDFNDHSDETVKRYTQEIKRLRKLLEDANRGAERNAHVNQLLAVDLLKMTHERDAWRKLVVEHNARMIRDDVESYLIDIPPELEQP